MKSRSTSGAPCGVGWSCRILPLPIPASVPSLPRVLVQGHSFNYRVHELSFPGSRTTAIQTCGMNGEIREEERKSSDSTADLLPQPKSSNHNSLLSDPADVQPDPPASSRFTCSDGRGWLRRWPFPTPSDSSA